MQTAVYAGGSGQACKTMVAGMSSRLTLCIHPAAQGGAEIHDSLQLGRLSGIELTHAPARQSIAVCFGVRRRSVANALCLQPATKS